MNEPNPTRRHGITMFILMWVALIGVLALVFQHWLDKENNPNQQVNSRLSPEGSREVVLERNRFGHYVVSGHINDFPVQFMLDTGASDVSVPERIAKRIGLQRGPEVTYNTANGPARGYMTQINTIRIGTIELHNLRASINPNVDDEDILLGMSFLKQLEFTQRGNTLTLRQIQNY
ncbi:MAG: TIGR02281 family clan AA aspartic protease [Gammaproteobacteria bacterium]|nr:TIGR02281 family clan AA aspartic protease [Gammaproteobacteria bacterium]